MNWILEQDFVMTGYYAKLWKHNRGVAESVISDMTHAAFGLHVSQNSERTERMSVLNM